MRKYYLDNIRWITVVMVVIYHVFYMYNAEGILGGLGKITSVPVQPYDIFLYFVYPWFMPVLFLVSGICSRLYLESHTDREFIKNRTRKLLVPSTIGLFVFQFIQGYVSISLSSGFTELAAAHVPKPVIFLIMAASGIGVLWFIQLLWLYSVILILLKKAERGKLLRAGAKTPVRLILLFYFLIWGAAQILNTSIISVYRIAFYFVFFILGYYVFSNDEVMEKLKRYAIPLITIGVSVCVIFSILYFNAGANYADKPVNRRPLYAACAYFGSLAVLSGMARFGDCGNRFTKWMSRRSFGLYVFHYLGISSVALLIAKPRLLTAPVCYLSSLAAGFVYGFGLYEIVSRIPFFRWAVLGIKKEKKNVSG